MRFTIFFTCLTFLGMGSPAFAGHHTHRRHHARSSAASDAAKMNNPSSGPPASDFEASANLPAAKLAAAAKKAKKAGQKYQISQGSKTYSTIYTDWADFKTVSPSCVSCEFHPIKRSLTQGSAYVWTADMDIDCDGIDYKCNVNLN